MPTNISACIITYNEHENIRRCLESVMWCDEVVIVDSFSTDDTLEICREYTDKVYQHEWGGYIAQRNYIRHLAAGPWILFLDADEEVSPELRRCIEREFARESREADGYEFPRLVYYLGKWIKHGEWYPDVKLRLFKKDRGRSGGVEPHDQVLVQGVVKRLRGPIWHYTYKDLFDHLNTMNRFSSISARSKHEQGDRFRWRDFLFRPIWRFAKGYFVKVGVLDGLRGFVIASVSAFGVSMKYAKLWELQWREGPAKELGKSSKDSDESSPTAPVVQSPESS